jgi:surface antigen
MRMMLLGTCLTMGFAMLAASEATMAAQDKAATIKEVMKKAHVKGGLVGKVKDGTATEADGKELLALYKDLAKDTPPKGDAADWKMKTEALIKAAQLFVDGKKDEAKAALPGPMDCKACHAAHK